MVDKPVKEMTEVQKFVITMLKNDGATPEALERIIDNPTFGHFCNAIDRLLDAGYDYASAYYAVVESVIQS